MKWVKINSQLIDGMAIQKVVANKTEICLINTNGRFSACKIKCPHAGADLSNGWLIDNQIVCPFHRHQFDLDNGRGAPGQGDYLAVYEVEKREDGVYVQLPEKWWKGLFK
jgi:nitrite reductase/ring-hydroxylating ferredoxin subunit